MVIYAYVPSTWDSKTGLVVQDLSWLHSKTMERKRGKLYTLKKFRAFLSRDTLLRFIFFIFLFINLYSVSCSSTTCYYIVCPDSAWWAQNLQFEPELALMEWKLWRLTMKNIHTLSRCLGKREPWSCKPGKRTFPTTASWEHQTS